MSLLSLILGGHQPEGGVLGYATRHLAKGNPLGQIHAQVDAGIDHGRDQIIAGLNSVIGEHDGQWDDIVKALADSAITAAAAAVHAAADKVLPDQAASG
jgi:hypothetical protein